MAEVYFSLPDQRYFQFIKGAEDQLSGSDFGFVYKAFEDQKAYVIKAKARKLHELPVISWTFNALEESVLSKEAYLSKLDSLINLLDTSELKKVVFSRKSHHPVQEININHLLTNLRQGYPKAFIYALKSERFGIWIGASPEILIRGGNKNFHTVSLAGTKAAGKGEWKPKEKEEQQIVTDYINELLEASGATDIELNGPYSTNAGPVDHLRTDISFSYAKDTLALLDQLSPTPAVCGVPKELSLNWIMSNELGARGLYSSYIGYYQGDKIDAFVNLRSMQIGSNGLRLYLGGGITKDSVAHDEWNETELKAKTLLDLL